MRRLLCFFAMSLTAGLGAGAAELDATKQEVSFEVGAEEIVGTLVQPACAAKKPVVLILHGMSGNRHGPQIAGTGRYLFAETARLLAEAGFASLRFSTRGRGGSDGDYLDMTLERRVEEALAAVNWIADRSAFDSDQISILGHSQGTLIAASAAKRLARKHPIRSLVLWAPQVDALKAYTRAMGAVTMQRGLAAKPGEVIRWRGAGGRIRGFRSGFFRGLSEFNAISDLADYGGPFLVVTGRRDSWSPPWRAAAFTQIGPDVKLMDFDVGHRMGAAIGNEAVNDVARAASTWLAAKSHGSRCLHGE